MSSSNSRLDSLQYNTAHAAMRQVTNKRSKQDTHPLLIIESGFKLGLCTRNCVLSCVSGTTVENSSNLLQHFQPFLEAFLEAFLVKVRVCKMIEHRNRVILR